VTDRPTDARIEIRRAMPQDAEAVAEVYLTSIRATYEFPLAHSDDEVRAWIARLLHGPDEAWVALEPGDDPGTSSSDGRIVGLAVVGSGELDQLYVAPDRLGRGIGRRLLDIAKARSPDGLRLYTFQVNERARRFYERNGFVAVAFGDGSGNEEGQPDVRYVWQPSRRG
jgi:ribosomal protein S18 acetylase RimI-like enzyme